MKVPERNKMIAECVNELKLAHEAYLQQLGILTQKYKSIPNVAEKFRNAFEFESDVEKIGECIDEFQNIHDECFPRGMPLSDEQWETCIKRMDEAAKKYKDTIPEIAGALCMAYLDDIEEYHKKWVEFKNGKT